MKTLASIDEIRAEIQRRIIHDSAPGGHCTGCLAPNPIRIDDDGLANWTADAASTASRGCEGFVLDIVASVRREYDLPKQLLAEAVASLMGGRSSPLGH